MEVYERALAELQAGMDLVKCRQCGCMRGVLEALEALPPADDPNQRELAEQATVWLGQMAPVRYSCLGCEHCFPAVASNALAEAQLIGPESLACSFEATDRGWPVAAGDYVVTCTGQDCPVAVSTLASTALADELAQRQPTGLCIVGKTETENIGIDKVVKNVVANPALRYLIVAGRDPDGHRSGQTLVALANNGVDDNMRVVGSAGRRPILRNVTRGEVEAFRTQVQVVDMIGCEDVDQLVARVEALAEPGSSRGEAQCECGAACAATPAPARSAPEVIVAKPSERVEMDRAGYFVIIPDVKRKLIVVEHYTYDNSLQHVIEGTASQDIYQTAIDAGWVSQLSHAAYLGRELATAELALRHGFPYVQDKSAAAVAIRRCRNFGEIQVRHSATED